MGNLLEFVIIETLNGNLKLKELTKCRFQDYIQLEIYAKDISDAKKQFVEYKNDLKKAGI